MADVQRENGHLDIANELAEAFARHKFSPDEWRILWVVIRKTYGWQKKADMISLSQFATMTGMKAAHCCRALSRLVSRNVITRSGNTHSGNTHSGNTNSGNTVREYAIQKDFDAWSQVSTTCSGNTHSGNRVLPKQVDTNTTITNTKIQESGVEKPKRKKRTQDEAQDLSSLEIPDFLLASEEWKKQWAQWIEHKASIKNHVTLIAARANIKRFTEWGLADSIKFIVEALASGWKGIYAPRGWKPSPPEKPKTPKQIEAEAVAAREAAWDLANPGQRSTVL